jgi:Flp pilus assembly protein TadG
MKILREERGQSTVFVALVMGIIMLGFVALALDVGYLFSEKRMAQAAADAAALAAAEEVSANASTASEQNAANSMATLNGFNTALVTNPAQVFLTTPATGYVQAVVSQPIHTFFMGVFNSNMQTVTVAASAVAGGNQTAPACVCLEGTSGMDLNMSNNAKLNASGCNVTVDSASTNAAQMIGSASLSTPVLGLVSTTWNTSYVNNGGTINSSKVDTGVAACAPNITVPVLPPGITCYNNPIQGWVLPGYKANYTLPLQNVTLTNGTHINEVATNNTICYNSLNLSDASSVTFSPGYTYYIKGDFTTGGGAPVTGNGVTFVVMGNIDIANGVTVNLSAPTVSGVPQTLFYDMGTSAIFEGGSNSNFSGLIDAPNAAITLNNGTGTTTNMDIVAQTLTMAGGAALNSYSAPNLGTSNTTIAKLVQ